jgi:hypothetical protein|tara:strand:+ start:155 stop:391 length:237 start_codon:yes stop_codon:yes gene_type:complete
MEKEKETENSSPEEKLNLTRFLHILKKLIIHPIISEKSPEETIKDLANDLGELFIFLWKFALNIKDSTFIFLKDANNE